MTNTLPHLLHMSQTDFCCYIYLAEGEDYVPESDSFIFNDFSARGFCLNVSIIDDMLVEASEDFLVCASTDRLRAPDILFIPTCASVNLVENDGMKHGIYPHI